MGLGVKLLVFWYSGNLALVVWLFVVFFGCFVLLVVCCLWLVGWLVGGLVGWLVGLNGWLVDWLVGLGCLVAWLLGCLVAWWVGGLVGWWVCW